MEKIDVSETDNFHYKDKYQLTSVPTIVVLNEEDIIGKVVGVDFGKVKELV